MKKRLVTNSNFLFLIILQVFLSGCSIALTKEGRQVRLFQGQQNPSCSYKGLVDGSFGGGWGIDEDIIGARNEMLNQAAELGANWIKVTHNSSDSFSTTMSGTAYSCEDSTGMERYKKSYSESVSTVNYEAMMMGANQISSAISNSYQNNSYNQNQAPVDNTMVVGTAPFCIMDNYGNLECYYYDLGSCRSALKYKFGNSACVKR